MNSVFQEISIQKVLFSDSINRIDLLSLAMEEPINEIIIRVHRNHNFELLQKPLEAYLKYSNIKPKWVICNYDDSLSFDDLRDFYVNLEIIWLDVSRYKDSSYISDWLQKRILVLRSKTEACILVANFPEAEELNLSLESWAENIPNLTIADFSPLASILNNKLLDSRLNKLSASRLSETGFLYAARLLGSRYIPSLVLGKIKAIAVDLDNTLYSGVLAEEGIHDLVLTDNHAEIQNMLVALVDSGIMLVCVSKNDIEDVKMLFDKRKDFPLKSQHFADWQVSWQSKSNSLLSASKKLCINLDTFLFIDDNPGELDLVFQELPMVRLLWSGDALLARNSLSVYPCLWRHSSIQHTDKVRAKDINANEKRKILLKESNDQHEYLNSLNVHFDFFLNPEDQVFRLSELSQKTNQFNMSLRRLTELNVSNRIQDPNHIMVSVSMQDRLSDSGNIAALFGYKEEDTLIIDELCISCRALGRNIEDIIIGEATRFMLDSLELSKMSFTYKIGHRNQPALKWLSSHSDLIFTDETPKKNKVSLNVIGKWWSSCDIKFKWYNYEKCR